MESSYVYPYELRYSDLMVLSSENVSFTLFREQEEIERLKHVRRGIIESLGPCGHGLLTITGVPKAPELRRNLLPFARKLALLRKDARNRILSEHGLGSDVPLKNSDRSVSSFAMQLKYQKAQEFKQDDLNHQADFNSQSTGEQRYDGIGSNFKELGYCMMDLGVRLARICDRAIDGLELEDTLLESCSAKGRLIHYHSPLDKHFIDIIEGQKESTERQDSQKSQSFDASRSSEHGMMDGRGTTEHGKLSTGEKEVESGRNVSDLWQHWHYDYGIFTLLTAPFFMLSTDKPEKGATADRLSCKADYPYPNHHTHLQILDPIENHILNVRASTESIIVQVGESATVLSKGKLKATLHCVARPEYYKTAYEALSRETFVVFMHPAWTKRFSTIDMQSSVSCHKSPKSFDAESTGSELECNTVTQEIHKLVPPLLARLIDGMSFGEFSRETTKQYYGGNGLQSKR